jgi:tRNA (cytidine/uridine-2'-O-)-methyltransferase
LEDNKPKYVPRIHVVLYQPEIPPNTGAVGRTCVAVGAKLWLVRPLGFQVDEKTRRRAGLDYWQHLEWEVVDHWQALQHALPNKRFWYFSKRGTRGVYQTSLAVDDVFVFGSETNGLPASLTESCPTQLLRIPTRSDVRSLNLSCSVAVVAYEALRQFGDLNQIDLC